MPKFFDLCSDSLWGIRKACAECFMMVSNSTSPEVRRAKLSPLFISLISDQSRWVRHTQSRTHTGQTVIHMIAYNYRHVCVTSSVLWRESSCCLDVESESLFFLITVHLHVTGFKIQSFWKGEFIQRRKNSLVKRSNKTSWCEMENL